VKAKPAKLSLQYAMPDQMITYKRERRRGERREKSRK